MKKIIILFLILVFFGMFFKENYAVAQEKSFPYWGPIMSCNTQKLMEGDKWLGAYCDPCSNICDLLATAQNALFFGISLALFAGAPILFVIIGIYYIISRGSPEKIKKAKDMFWNVIKGIVIILLSFVIVNTFFITIAPKLDKENIDFVVKWNQIQCTPQSIPGSNIEWHKSCQRR